MRRDSQPLSRSFMLSIFEHIIGVSVSATKPEISTAPASVSANSVNSLPVRPGVNATGANTATRVRVMATMAKPISLLPLSAASRRGSPCSMCR